LAHTPFSVCPLYYCEVPENSQSVGNCFLLFFWKFVGSPSFILTGDILFVQGCPFDFFFLDSSVFLPAAFPTDEVVSPHPPGSRYDASDNNFAPRCSPPSLRPFLPNIRRTQKTRKPLALPGVYLSPDFKRRLSSHALLLLV